MVEYEQQDSHPNPNQWWFHRRVMAYISLAAILITLIAALCGGVNKEASPLIEGICWILGLLVAAYYANNAFEAFAKVRR